ncbi:hypothetical protein [Shewanella psychrophila]|uniref:hypothetical protein n=1 Tax=Shewanella psychrophila TaxID=225848 RepID=UPI00202A433B|nr:hypothetical protein [Shewanella psychrophila]
MLASYGYDGMDQSTIKASLPGMQLLMSWIPAGFAFAGVILMLFYPLGCKQNQEIGEELAKRSKL